MTTSLNNINYTTEELNSTSESLYLISTTLISQVINLLNLTILNDESLSFTSNLIPGSTIGKHLRHVHDHFRLLLDSLSTSSSSSSSLTVSYDHRDRNTLVETSHSACLNSFESLLKRLELESRNVEGSREVLVVAVTPEKMGLKSSFGRELWFTCLHAIHHFSLLRVIAAGELNLTVPSDLGVAPSTLAYRAKL